MLSMTLLFSLVFISSSSQANTNTTSADWKRNASNICGGKVKSARIRLKLNYEIFKISNDSSPTNRKLVRLYSRNGYLVEVKNGNRITGTTNTNSKRTWFELQSYGRSIVRLKHKLSGRYLAINWRGRPVMQLHIKTDSLFKTKMEDNSFHSFASHKYYKHHRHDLFIGIKKNGSFKSPLSTLALQTSVQFLILEFVK